MSSMKMKCSRIRELFLLNLDDPRNFGRYSSVKAMQLEQMIQLKYFAYRIHPHSRFRICWETLYIGIMLITVAFAYIFLIIDTYDRWEHVKRISTLILADIPILINMVINFRTGIFEEDHGEINFELTKIAIKYLKFEFIFDVIGLVFGSMTVLFLYALHLPWSITYEWFITTMSLGLFFRLMSPLNYWNYSVSKYFLLDGLITTLVKFAFFFPVFALFIATVAFTLFYREVDSSLNNVSSILNVFSEIFLKVWAKSEVVEANDNVIAIIFNVCVLIFPFIQFFTVTCLIVLFFWSKRGAADRYNDLIDNLNAYLQQVSISDRLKVRIVKFYEETFKGKYYSEVDILQGLSSELKEDILSIKISSLRQEITILGMIPLQELLLIAQHLVSEVYFTNDVIGYSGALLDRMYFIARGSVAVYTDEATELYHISNSNLFLPASVAIESFPLLCNYMACETTTLYSISRIDHATIKDKVPIFNELITYMAELFVETHMYAIEKERGELDK